MSSVKILSSEDEFLRLPELPEGRRAGLVFWAAALLLFAALHHPSARLAASAGLFSEAGWATVRGLVCVIALLGIALPLLRDLYLHVRSSRREIALSLGAAALIFPLLCLLIFPVAWSAGGALQIEHGLGTDYARMSLHPFTESNELFYRRLLQPLLAHWLQLDGLVRYGFLSLGSVFLLLCLQVHFLRLRSAGALLPAGAWGRGALTVLALSTCGQIMVGIEWPGYPETFAFIFLLLPAVVPLTGAGRLASIVLASTAFDGAIVVAAALVCFCFPSRERWQGLAVVGFYLFFFALSHEFKLQTPFEQHQTIGQDSFIADLWRHPGVVLFGIFASFKFFWLAVPVALGAAMVRQRRFLALGLAGVTCSFLPLLFVAWDVTRFANFGFVGLLLCVASLHHLEDPRGWIRRRLLPVLAALSLLFPSYNVALYFIHHGERNQDGRVNAFRDHEHGLYRLISDGLDITLPHEPAAEKRSP